MRTLTKAAEGTSRATSFFGSFFTNLTFRFDGLRENWIKQFRGIYEESGITIFLEDYIMRMPLFMAGSFVATAVASTLIHSYLLHLTSSKLVLAVFSLSIAAMGLAGFLTLLYPLYLRSQNRGKLENGLIYSLSYMAVLSASGMPIERIIERVLEVEDNPPLIHLAKKFIMNVKLFGFDVLSALKNIADRSPSKILAKQLESMRTTIQTSGDLKGLLMYEVERQLQRKRESMKAMLTSLVYIGELYVTLMVVTPVLFILMITILSVMGGRSLGGSPVLQLNLIVFLGIPIMAGAFLIFLDMFLEAEE